eukprot:1147769-Pelagomonas_calceolata.AAC.2
MAHGANTSLPNASGSNGMEASFVMALGRMSMRLGKGRGCRAEEMLELSARICQILRWAIQDDVLFVLYSVPITYVANPKLVWAPISMMPLGFHAKVVIGKA